MSFAAEKSQALAAKRFRDFLKGPILQDLLTAISTTTDITNNHGSLLDIMTEAVKTEVSAAPEAALHDTLQDSSTTHHDEILEDIVVGLTVERLQSFTNGPTLQQFVQDVSSTGISGHPGLFATVLDAAMAEISIELKVLVNKLTEDIDTGALHKKIDLIIPANGAALAQAVIEPESDESPKEGAVVEKAVQDTQSELNRRKNSSVAAEFSDKTLSAAKHFIIETASAIEAKKTMAGSHWASGGLEQLKRATTVLDFVQKNTLVKEAVVELQSKRTNGLNTCRWVLGGSEDLKRAQGFMTARTQVLVKKGRAVSILGRRA